MIDNDDDEDRWLLYRRIKRIRVYDINELQWDPRTQLFSNLISLINDQNIDGTDIAYFTIINQSIYLYSDYRLVVGLVFSVCFVAKRYIVQQECLKK